MKESNEIECLKHLWRQAMIKRERAIKQVNMLSRKLELARKKEKEQ